MNHSDTIRGLITNIDDLKAAIDIDMFLPLIGCSSKNRTTMKGDLRIPCVVHNGDGNNLSINVQDKIAHCFVCDFKGDLIELYQKANGINDFRQAVQALADNIGFTLQYEGATKTDMSGIPSYEPIIRTPQQVIDEAAPLLELTPYLKNKCVDLCKGLYIGKNDGGYESIVVPLKDIKGNMRTVQFIQHDGRKFFLRGGEVSCTFFVIDDAKIKGSDTVYLAEGLATALTIWMSYNKSVPVISFGSAGNLANVANALIQEYPNIKMVVCLDHNTAAFKKASELKCIESCSYCWPSFELLAQEQTGGRQDDLADFNDIVSKCDEDLSIVKSQLATTHNYNAMYKEFSILKLMKAQEADKAIVAPCNIEIDDERVDSFEKVMQDDCIKYLISRDFGEVVDEGIDLLLSLDHFTGLNRIILDAILKTHALNQPVNSKDIALNAPDEYRTAVYEHLKKISTLESITAEQVIARIDKLSIASTRRQLQSAVNEASKDNNLVQNVIGALRQNLDVIQGNSVNVLNQKQKLLKMLSTLNNPKNAPIPTGLKSFDKLLGGGLQKGELIVVTAGAGAGKSAFALQVADSVAKNGMIAIYYSAEVSEEMLTDRTLKRLSYDHFTETREMPSPRDWRQIGVPLYEPFCQNVYIERGHDGTTVAEVWAKVLSIMRRTTQDVFLVIDPFQRLETGDEQIDTNETIKTGKVISDIKRMAVELNIPIMAISDTTKGHKDNVSGDGAGRNSYMIDHVCDVNLMLRTSRDAKAALIGSESPRAEKTEQEPIIDKAINTKLVETKNANNDNKCFYVKGYQLKGNYDVYAALVCPKARNNAKMNPLFIYHKDYHYFEDIKFYDGMQE